MKALALAPRSKEAGGGGGGGGSISKWSDRSDESELELTLIEFILDKYPSSSEDAQVGDSGGGGGGGSAPASVFSTLFGFALLAVAAGFTAARSAIFAVFVFFFVHLESPPALPATPFASVCPRALFDFLLEARGVSEAIADEDDDSSDELDEDDKSSSESESDRPDELLMSMYLALISTDMRSVSAIFSVSRFGLGG